MKKIAFLIGSLTGGGAEQVCVTLLNNCVRIGYEVELIVLHLKDSKYLNRVSKRVKIVNLNTERVRYSLWKLLKYLYWYKPDICVIFNYQISIAVSFLNLFISPRIKIISRCINTLSYKLNSINILLKYVNKIVIKSAYSYSDIIISQSEGMKNDLVNNFRINYSKIKTINNPLNELIESNINKDNDIKEDYLFCIGRLEKQKNFKMAIESFAQLSHKFPYLKLKIAGIGLLKEELKELTIRLGIKDKVEFIGFVEGNSLIRYYRKARLTLLTSLFEGFPNVLIESMALGTPVISVNCPSGPSEIIEDKINGILVESYNSEDFAKAIISGLEFDWDYESVKNTTRRYSSQLIVNKYIRIIEELLC